MNTVDRKDGLELNIAGFSLTEKYVCVYWDRKQRWNACDQGMANEENSIVIRGLLLE